MSITSFLNYISLEKNGSNHTTKAYRKNLEAFKNFLSSQDSAIRIENVSYNEIRSWIVFLIESGNSKRTVNSKISTLRSYYKFLLKIKTIEVSPKRGSKRSLFLLPKTLINPFEKLMSRILREINSLLLIPVEYNI